MRHAVALFLLVVSLVATSCTAPPAPGAVQLVATELPTHTPISDTPIPTTRPRPSVTPTRRAVSTSSVIPISATRLLSPTGTIATVPVASATAVVTVTATTSPTPTVTTALPPLVVWTSEQDDGLRLVQELTHIFAVASGQPFIVVPYQPATLRTDLLAAQMTNQPLPALIWGDQDDLAELLLDGQLQPVDDLVDPSQVVTLALIGATYEEQLWGIPLSIQGFLLLFSNRALIAAAPSTSDALIAASRTMPQVEGHPERYGLAAAWTEARWLAAWLHGFGGSLTTPDGMQPTLNTPPMINTLHLLAELAAAAPPDQQAYAMGNELFRNGQVGMMIDGDWSLTVYRNLSPTLDLGIAPLPMVSATGTSAASLYTTSYLMFYRDISDTERQQARDFTLFLTSPEGQQRLVQELRRLPAYQASLTSGLIDEYPELVAAAQQIEHGRGIPPTRAIRCAFRALNQHLPELFDAQTDPSKLAETMQASADGCMQP